MIDKFKNVLVLAPHTDDAEYGCGGLLHRLKKNRANICIKTFSYPQDKPIIVDEFKKSMNFLDVVPDLYSFKLRRFNESRQDILELIYNLVTFPYDLILTPSTKDTHQDHEVISQETIRVFKDRTILGYIIPYNCMNISMQMFVSLSEDDLKFKQKLLRCYKSQEERIIMDEEYIKAQAIYYGKACKSQYAELYEPIRIIV